MSDVYDPQEEEGRRPSQYVTRKDFRLIALVLILLTPLGWFLFTYMLAKVHASLCKKNMKSIGEALHGYLLDNDERMPFAYETLGYGSSEMRLRDGKAFSWQWPLQPYTKNWDVFVCPAAEKSEHTHISDPNGVVHVSDYGVLNGYSGLAYSSIANPGQKVFASETSNYGALGTYDPMPLRVGGKTITEDGFLLGFDNNQNFPNPQTKTATRLAFPGSAKSGFDSKSPGRHPAGIHFLYLDGSASIGGGDRANVNRLGESYGQWDVPKPLPPFSPRPRRP